MACSAWEYGVVKEPLVKPRGAVASPPPGILSGRSCVVTVKLSVAGTVTPPLVTETDTENVPVFGGVPLSTPALETEMPSTAAPDQM